MNLWKLFPVFALLIFGASGVYTLGAQTQSSASPSTSDEKPSISLSAYLMTIGQEYDCYFTIEKAWPENDSTDSITVRSVQRPSQLKSLKQQLEQLQQDVPDLVYEFDRANPRLIHIKDKRLDQQKDYALESVIKSIDFKGSLHELVDEITRQGIAVTALRITFNQETLDYDTTVRVKAEGLKVRDALSNFILLEGRRSRILWIAGTELRQNKVTDIRYP